MKRLSTGSLRFRSMTAAFSVALLMAACNSQPAKYRHSNDCKCPKWNHVPKPPAGNERADGRPAVTPYHCGTGSRS